MNPILNKILAVIAGFLVGGVVNSSIVKLGPMVIPNPPGTDFTTVEGLQAAAHLLKTENFIFPFLAHFMGTAVGAWVATLIASTKKYLVALIVGGIFLLGGITACFMIPAPIWFIFADLCFAYLPIAAYIGKKAESNLEKV
jgi:hypothetical protein